jgi:VanZ family protein
MAAFQSALRKMKSIARLRHEYPRALCILAWFCAGFLVYLAIIPNELEIRTGVPGELEHLVAYGIAAVMFTLCYPRRGLLISAALIIHACLLETAQIWLPGRTASLFDAGASGTGVVIGGLAASIMIRRCTCQS